MVIKVIAHTKSKKPRILEREPGVFDVYVAEIPEGGKANTGILKILKANFAKAKIKLIKGKSSKYKTFSII